MIGSVELLCYRAAWTAETDLGDVFQVTPFHRDRSGPSGVVARVTVPPGSAHGRISAIVEFVFEFFLWLTVVWYEFKTLFGRSC